jgi:hypothetical protein
VVRGVAIRRCEWIQPRLFSTRPHGEPRVRILLPPAESLRTIGPSAAERNRGFESRPLQRRVACEPGPRSNVRSGRHRRAPAQLQSAEHAEESIVTVSVLFDMVRALEVVPTKQIHSDLGVSPRRAINSAEERSLPARNIGL